MDGLSGNKKPSFELQPLNTDKTAALNGSGGVTEVEAIKNIPSAPEHGQSDSGPKKLHQYKITKAQGVKFLVSTASAGAIGAGCGAAIGILGGPVGIVVGGVVGLGVGACIGGIISLAGQVKNVTENSDASAESEQQLIETEKQLSELHKKRKKMLPEKTRKWSKMARSWNKKNPANALPVQWTREGEKKFEKIFAEENDKQAKLSRAECQAENNLAHTIMAINDEEQHLRQLNKKLDALKDNPPQHSTFRGIVDSNEFYTWGKKRESLEAAIKNEKEKLGNNGYYVSLCRRRDSEEITLTQAKRDLARQKEQTDLYKTFSRYKIKFDQLEKKEETLVHQRADFYNTHDERPQSPQKNE